MVLIYTLNRPLFLSKISLPLHRSGSTFEMFSGLNKTVSGSGASRAGLGGSVGVGLGAAVGVELGIGV